MDFEACRKWAAPPQALAPEPFLVETCSIVATVWQTALYSDSSGWHVKRVPALHVFANTLRSSTSAGSKLRRPQPAVAVHAAGPHSIHIPKGFKPLRAEPNGFLVHLLSHSDKVSVVGTRCLLSSAHVFFLAEINYQPQLVSCICSISRATRNPWVFFKLPEATSFTWAGLLLQTEIQVKGVEEMKEARVGGQTQKRECIPAAKQVEYSDKNYSCGARKMRKTRRHTVSRGK